MHKLTSDAHLHRLGADLDKKERASTTLASLKQRRRATQESLDHAKRDLDKTRQLVGVRCVGGSVGIGGG
jgi:hypothetical protein